MNNLSLILLTKNESENISKWSKWIHKLKKVNELIVVDDESTDNTVTLLKKLGTKSLKVNVIINKLDNDFGTQRQHAVAKASNDWILWLDADEEPSEDLIDYINHIDNDQYNYAFPRSDIFLGTKLHHGETSAQYFLRLFNKNHGFFSGMVHELWVSSIPTLNIDHEILHSSHKTLKSFFEKINYYSDIRAQELFNQKTPVTLFHIIAYPLGKFLQNYFLRLGFLDSTPGIIIAIGMSFHSFLVRSKLWCLYNP